MDMPAKAITFRFGRFVLEAKERRLWDGRREINLRPKTLDTLIFLVERQGHLVTKNELLDRIWNDVEVTENTLVQCIRELREALRDDARNPQFIQTVKPAGYRFIAEVAAAPAPDEEAEYEEMSALSIAVLDEVHQENRPDGEPLVAAKSVMRRRWFAYATAGLLVLAGLFYWFYPRRAGTGLVPRDSILITDFDNYTGKPVFEAALRTALERELQLSAYVGLVPRGRVLDTLRMMQRKADTRITEEVGREICLRDGGIRALLCGSIQDLGGAYSIALKIVDPVNGAAIAVLSDRAPSAPDTLTTIQSLARELRRRLGEPLKAAARTDSLPRVTTRSLEALDLYSRGAACLERLEYGQAENYLDQAIEADPEFAMSHALRGVVRFMTSRDSSADFRRSAELAQNVTLPERLMIEASNALVNEKNLLRAIEIYRSATDQFPDSYGAHEGASWCYFWAKDYRDWSKHQAVIRRLRPNFPQAVFHAGWVHLFCDGDLETAQSEFNRVLELNPEFSSVTVQMFPAIAHWMRGETDAAEGGFRNFMATRLVKMPAFTQLAARPYLARFFSFAGKRADALALLESNRGMTFPISSAVIAGRFREERAALHEEAGDRALARRLLEEEASGKVGIERVEALGWLGIVEARAGMGGEARRRQSALEQENRVPMVTFWSPPLPQNLEGARRAFSLAIEGEILLRDKKYNEAIERFENVRRIVPPRQALFETEISPRVFLEASQSLARAQELRGDWDGASRTYESILRNRHLCLGTPAASGIWIRALNSIGAALEKAGRSSEAARYRREYLSLRPQ